MRTLRRDGVGPAGPALAGRLCLAFALALLAGCGGGGGEEGDGGEADPGTNPEAEVAPEEPPVPAPRGGTLLVRGVIRGDSVSLEPAFLLPDSTPAAPGTGGGHRVVGYDADGSILFEEEFEPAPVADLPGGQAETHFQLSIPLMPAQADRLARIEVHLEDGRTAVRRASHSGLEVREFLVSQDTFQATRLNESQVEITWDAAAFPLIMVRDPAAGDVLAFGREGSVTVTTDLYVLEVLFSDGVQSGVLTLRVD